MHLPEDIFVKLKKMKRWEGRTALVTGASRGFGAAIARQLVLHGMKVIGCARNVEKIEEQSAALSKEKGMLLPVKCDIAKENQILSMFERIRKEVGGIDVCVNNAGLAYNAPLLSGKTEEWRHMFESCVNVMYPLSLAGHNVINIPAFHMYCATKFAITAITEGLEQELNSLAPHIRVTGISPGLAETDIVYRMFSDEPGTAKDLHNKFENLQSDDIADAVIYALSAPQRCQVHDILLLPREKPL